MPRREALKETAACGLAIAAATSVSLSAPPDSPGAIAGEPRGEETGRRVLADGGNAVDALVAGALTAMVSSPHQTGVGGYGGVMVIATTDGQPPIAIDFNGPAPQALTKNAFRPGPDGKVPGQINERGWLASGVPGVLAGLQLALDRYGTRRFGELAQGAIALARDGFAIDSRLAAILRTQAPVLAQDPGSRKLYFRDDKPLGTGDHFRNPELAELLTTLAQRNSVASFYQGDIADRLVDAFAQHGGLLTRQDLAAYRPREAATLAIDWGDYQIHTAPLTAGGITVLQALKTLKSLGQTTTQARIDALRLAWHDRLTQMGDPDFVAVPVDRLLSDGYAGVSAERVHAAVQAQQPLKLPAAASRDQNGTIHLSVVDRQGMLACATLTHGGSFGARITVEGLGLTLGHGMSRFDVDPDHPNAPGPGKRPLHNMCPTIVTKGGKGIFALGARGGRRIPNAVFEVLLALVQGKSLADSLAAPRLHTEGDLQVTFEPRWPVEDRDACQRLGYTVKTGDSAVVSAVSFDHQRGTR